MAASGVSLVAGKTQNWGFVETKTLIGLWAEEDIQRQLPRVVRKTWEGTAMKLRKRLQAKRRPMEDHLGYLFIQVVLTK